MVLKSEERTQIALNILNKIPSYETLPENVKELMVFSFALGMLEMNALYFEEDILDIKLKINKLKHDGL